MTDEVHALLSAPWRTQKKIYEMQSKQRALRYRLLPSGIRYDRNKVQTSPADVLAEVEAEICSIDDDIAKLKDRKLEEQRLIEAACEKLPECDERTVVKMRFIGDYSIWQIMDYMHQSRRTVYRELTCAYDMLSKII